MYRILAKINNRSEIGKNTFELNLSIEKDSFSFTEGQYIWLVLSKLDFPDPRGERRAFSITSIPKDNTKLTVIYRDSDSGYKKTLANLQPGSTVQIIGPFGSSYVPEVDQKKIVMIAGGVGIAPFLSILRSLRENQNQIEYTLIYLNSSPNSGVYYDDLTNLASLHNFNLINHNGKLSENILPTSIDFVSDTFFICGPNGMVDETYRILTTKGVPFAHMHFEQHYPSIAGNLTEDDFKPISNEKNIMFQAVQHSRNHVIVTDANGQIIFANKKAQESTGFTFDEMKGNTPRLWGGLMPKEFYQKFWRKKQEHVAFDGELTNRRKNGEIYYVLAHTSPILSNGAVVGYIATEEDITHIKVLEKQLTHEKLVDESLLASIGEGVVVNDRYGNVSFVNKSATDMLLYSKEDLIGKSFINIVATEWLDGKKIPEAERPLTKVTTSTKPIRSQLVYIRKNGTKFEAEVVVSPVYVQSEYYGNIHVIKDITKEKQLERLKDEFVSVASHELRTPLTAIDGLVSMIIDGEYGEINENLLEPLRDVNTSSERLIRLVNDLLSVSRIQAGRLKYNLSDFAPRPVISEVVDLLTPIAQEKRLTLTSGNVTEENVSADLDKVKQILNNLIGNAFKFTDQGSITVFTQEDNELVKIFVEDTGIGISVDDQQKLFGKFQQLESGVGRPAGTGLGLYLSLQMAKKMGGSLWLEKSEKEKGSVFAFSLPKANSELAQKVRNEINAEAQAILDQKSD